MVPFIPRFQEKVSNDAVQCNSKALAVKDFILVEGVLRWGPCSVRHDTLHLFMQECSSASTQEPPFPGLCFLAAGGVSKICGAIAVKCKQTIMGCGDIFSPKT